MLGLRIFLWFLGYDFGKPLTFNIELLNDLRVSSAISVIVLYFSEILRDVYTQLLGILGLLLGYFLVYRFIYRKTISRKNCLSLSTLSIDCFDNNIIAINLIEFNFKISVICSIVLGFLSFICGESLIELMVKMVGIITIMSLAQTH